MKLSDLKQYLRIDYDDEDAFLETLIEVSEVYITECCGEAYKSHERLLKLANIVQLKLISDMYEKRTASANESRDIVVATIFDKLSMAKEVI